eukprot:3882064-Rhodomonas_salina.3
MPGCIPWARTATAARAASTPADWHSECRTTSGRIKFEQSLEVAFGATVFLQGGSALRKAVEAACRTNGCKLVRARASTAEPGTLSLGRGAWQEQQQQQQHVLASNSGSEAHFRPEL